MSRLCNLVEICLLKIFLCNIKLSDHRFKTYIQRLFWRGVRELNVGIVEKTWLVASKLDCVTDAMMNNIHDIVRQLVESGVKPNQFVYLHAHYLEVTKFVYVVDEKL